MGLTKIIPIAKLASLSRLALLAYAGEASIKFAWW